MPDPIQETPPAAPPTRKQKGCPAHGEEFTASCRRCNLYRNDPRYRILWGGDAAGMPASSWGWRRPIDLVKILKDQKAKEKSNRPPMDFARLRTPCSRRGEQVGTESPSCGSCTIWSCSEHGECVLAGVEANGFLRSAAGRMACLTCSDYSPGKPLPSRLQTLTVDSKPSDPPASVPATSTDSSSTPSMKPAPTHRPVLNPPKWAVGVTTVESRRKDLLPRTLASLKKAGWDSPHLFVDGGRDSAGWEKEFKLDVTVRGGPPVRTAGAWVLSLYELYCRWPSADLFAVFQDDFVTLPNLRGYLERLGYPAPNGYANLYTFPSNEKLAPEAGQTKRRKIGWFKSNQFGRGAVGLVFSRKAVVELLCSRHLAERPQDCHRGHKAIDGGIVDSMKKAEWEEWCHWPSLLQHTGIASSMGNRPHPLSPSFPGEDYDALQLLDDAQHN